MKKHLITILCSLLPCASLMAQWNVQKTIISRTMYDLQSNASPGRKVVQLPNGEVSAIWISSNQAAPYSDRKNGYSYYTPVNGWLEQNTNSTGSAARKGFGVLCVNKNNEELIFSHAFGTASFTSILQKSTGFGKGGWKETKPVSNNLGVNGVNAGWHKMASAGDYIYVIARGLDKAPNGLINPIYFSKSTDGGNSFSNFTLLPGEDTANYPGNYSGTENYSIDAYDKYVAIIGSGDYTDLTLWKSEDYGVTFKRTIIEKFPIHGWARDNFPKSDVNKDGTPDTLSTNNRSMDVILDLQGNAHLFYGRKYYFQDKDTGYASIKTVYQEKPNQQIVYWNELTKTSTPIAGARDLNKDGKITKPANPLIYADYNLGLAGHPTTGIDKNGYLYMAYMAYNEGDTTNKDLSTVSGKLFHNIYFIFSSDKGKTWSQPVNITQTTYKENVFPSMARYVGDHIIIIYQEDTEPGTAAGSQASQGENEIRIADITKSTAGVHFNEQNTIGIDIYPNPNGSDRVTIRIDANQSEKTTVFITDIIGKSIGEREYYMVHAGENIFNKDISNLNQGMYFIQIRTNDGTVATQKLMVTR